VIDMTESNVGSAIRTRLGEIETELGQIEAQVAQLSSSAKPLKDERSALGKALHTIEAALGAGNGNGPAQPAAGAPVSADTDGVSYEDLKKAVRELGGPSKTTDIAAHLNVSPRKIARKLKKLADDGELAGDKDGGYRLA
jgi:hypothetical protein